MHDRARAFAVTCALSVMIGCGAAGLDAPPRPDDGTYYEILHRETLGFVEGESQVTETRIVLQVLGTRADGTRRLRARLYRSVDAEGAAGIADELVDFELSPDGAVLGAPVGECEDIPALDLPRYLRRVFGARAFVARRVTEGQRWRRDFVSDVLARPVPTLFLVESIDDDRIRGELLSRLEVDDDAVGPLRATGEGTTRGRFTLSRTDGFSGRTDLRSELEGTFADPRSGRRTGTLRLRSQIRVRPIDPAPAALERAFDPDRVVRAIRGQLPSIQSCYEEQLGRDPTLAGRVMVRLGIGVDGRIRDTTVTENSTGDPLVASCVERFLGEMRFAWGPACGDVHFAYPFVFAPQR